jgi:hypothetical protein
MPGNSAVYDFIIQDSLSCLTGMLGVGSFIKCTDQWCLGYHPKSLDIGIIGIQQMVCFLMPVLTPINLETLRSI